MTANVTAVEWYPAGGGPKITFSQSWPYRLRDISGADENVASLLTRKNPSQVGATAVDVEIAPRVIGVQVMVAGDDEEDLWTLRRTLVRAMAAAPARRGEDIQQGVLRVLRGSLMPLEVVAVPRHSPRGSKVRGAPVYSADIEFEVASPYWREVADSQIVFEEEEGGFEWALEFPLEMVANTVEAEIDNLGDVDAPIRAQIFGDCTTARLINVTTGETLEIGAQITAGEYIEINTAYGEKNVELVDIATSARSSAMSRLNLALADFWALRPGVNVVRFEADVNVSGSARFYWRERYVGI